MKKAKIIFNPSSGRQTMSRKIDYLVNLLVNEGYIVSKFDTEKKDDAMLETIKTCEEDWDFIIACGGDGTVNEVAKGMVKSSRKIPVAILASGTVNDFANFMKLPTNMDNFFKMIQAQKTLKIDLGKVNDEYFVNVAASGLLTSVGYQVPAEAKAVFGRLAYYIEGVKEIPRSGLDPIKVSFNSKEYTEQEEIHLFLITNTASIGGFKKLAPDANVSDGYLDVVIIKKTDIQNLAQIFINIFRGEHINHPDVSYFKSKKVTVETDANVSIDIDGEYGGKLPAVFEVEANSFEIFIP